MPRFERGSNIAAYRFILVYLSALCLSNPTEFAPTTVAVLGSSAVDVLGGTLIVRFYPMTPVTQHYALRQFYLSTDFRPRENFMVLFLLRVNMVKFQIFP